MLSCGKWAPLKRIAIVSLPMRHCSSWREIIPQMAAYENLRQNRNKSISPLGVHVQESSVEVWMGSKGGVLKALIGLCKIAESPCSGIIEDPQRPNHA